MNAQGQQVDHGQADRDEGYAHGAGLSEGDDQDAGKDERKVRLAHTGTIRCASGRVHTGLRLVLLAEPILAGRPGGARLVRAPVS